MLQKFSLTLPWPISETVRVFRAYWGKERKLPPAARDEPSPCIINPIGYWSTHAWRWRDWLFEGQNNQLKNHRPSSIPLASSIFHLPTRLKQSLSYQGRTYACSRSAVSCKGQICDIHTVVAIGLGANRSSVGLTWPRGIRKKSMTTMMIVQVAGINKGQPRWRRTT